MPGESTTPAPIQGFIDPAIRRWVALPYDQATWKTSIEVASEWIRALAAGNWIGASSGTLIESLGKLPSPIALTEEDRWRCGDAVSSQCLPWHREICVFRLMDALIISLQVTYLGGGLSINGLAKTWGEIALVIPTIPGGMNALSFWDHYIVELAESLDPENIPDMPDWDLTPLSQGQSPKFVALAHKKVPNRCMLLCAATDEARRSMSDFLQSSQYRYACLAASKMLNSNLQANHAHLRQNVESLSFNFVDSKKVRTLEQIDLAARKLAQSLSECQHSAAGMKRARITLECSLRTLDSVVEQNPAVACLFDQAAAHGRTLQQQIDQDEAYALAKLDELKTLFDVSQFNVQLRDAKYSRSLNKLFVILGFAGTFLAARQVHPTLPAIPHAEIIYWSVVGLLLAWALCLVLKSSSGKRKT